MSRDLQSVCGRVSARTCSSSVRSIRVTTSGKVLQKTRTASDWTEQLCCILFGLVSCKYTEAFENPGGGGELRYTHTPTPTLTYTHVDISERAQKRQWKKQVREAARGGWGGVDPQPALSLHCTHPVHRADADGQRILERLQKKKKIKQKVQKIPVRKKLLLLLTCEPRQEKKHPCSPSHGSTRFRTFQTTKLLTPPPRLMRAVSPHTQRARAAAAAAPSAACV